MTESKSGWRATLLERFSAERGAQVKFAREVKCSESHLSLVLKGKRGLSYDLAMRISAKIDVPLQQVLAPALASNGEGRAE